MPGPAAGFSPWRGLLRWLADVPIRDPVDRRNAPMVQVLLLLLGASPLALWGYRVFLVDAPWRPGELAAFASSMGVCAVVFIGVFLIRRGHFRWAVRQVLVVVALAMMLGAAQQGFTAGRFEQPLQTVWLVLSGLVLGRMALWLMFGWMTAAFAVGLGVDLTRGASPWLDFVVDGLVTVCIFLLVVVVVDRAGMALRASLQAASRRADELDWANARLEQELQERDRTRKHLVEVQKKEAVARMSLGVSHDFKHLLGLVAGYAEQGRATQAGVPAAHIFERITDVTRRASDLAERLLHFGRGGESEPTLFDAAHALRALHPLLRLALPASCRLQLTVAEAPCPAYLDRSGFELMALNFADNAGRAMPDGGTFAVDLRRQGERLALTFTDSGCGMDEATRERVFEPFFTTRAGEGGLGLGLGIVADFVHGAGGAVEVASQPGAGTRFRVTLPGSLSDM